MSDPFSQKSFQRVVIKVGSALLVDAHSGLRQAWLQSLAEDLRQLKATGCDVLVVSSGAIALGRGRLPQLPAQGALKLAESQAAAAVGQIALGQAFHDTFANLGLQAAQILLTIEDTENRRRYLNARATIETLLGWNAIPIINENDTVATSEIRYGDNDRLAARVTTMMDGDLLILLSDVDGLYDAPPADNPQARFLARIPEITPEIEAMAGDAAGDWSRGGMKTKIAAARIATTGGAAMMIAAGQPLRPLEQLRRGARYSWFDPSPHPMSQRQKWIAGGLGRPGRLVIDPGAAQALRQGRSLLPAGVVQIIGDFQRGDTVELALADGTLLGRGLTEYDAADARQIQGLSSQQIQQQHGAAFRPTLVHRNDLVLIKSPPA